jgi:hypothetical protein
MSKAATDTGPVSATVVIVQGRVRPGRENECCHSPVSVFYAPIPIMFLNRWFHGHVLRRWVSPSSTHPTTLRRDAGLPVGWVEAFCAETHRQRHGELRRLRGQPITFLRRRSRYFLPHWPNRPDRSSASRTCGTRNAATRLPSAHDRA